VPLLLALSLALVAGCRCGGGRDAGPGATDAGDAGAAGDGAVPCVGGPAPFVPLAAPAGETRFALSVFHFNLQYVAGGLEGYPLYEVSESDLEDAIIVQSFEPILDLFAAHPAWGTSLEMQGLMLDAMAARHPGVLAKLRALVEAGQVELQSAHWSDELVVAWPRRDLEWSIAATSASAAAACVAVGPTAFLQEGQFGEGVADALAQAGYGGLVWARNLHSYLHAAEPRPPRYTLRGLDLVVSGAVDDAASGVQTTWVFFNDGELAATGGLNPYAGPAFVTDPAAVTALEGEFQAAADAGFAVVSVAAYVAALDALGVAAVAAPAVLDGTWQPDDTQNLWRWMGGAGISRPSERDNGVLTAVRAARDDVLAAEVLVAAAAGAGEGAADDGARRDAAIRELLKAEVSDTTGWNPWLGEVEYGFEHAAAAAGGAQALVTDLLARLGWAYAEIDTATGTATEAVAPPPPEMLSPAAPLFTVVVAAGLRAVTADWYIDEAGDPLVEITVAPSGGGSATVEMRFPRGGTAIATPPAGLEGEMVRADESAFSFTQTFLPVASGVIELGPGRFLVKDTRTVHLAAGIGAGSAELIFRDETLPLDEAATYRFYVIDGSDAYALAKADAVNVHPLLWR
jgi:hypothetical protein